MSHVTIRQATTNDAAAIGRAIVMAVGEEIISTLGAPKAVEQMFADLAARSDTQYSWRNTIVAVAEDGAVAGVAVAYDGALLDTLRRPFFAEMTSRFNKDMSDVSDETDASEMYLDTLAVMPDYRRRGIARQLIDATASRAAAIGKPLGLLVDKDNDKARQLYTSAGFVYVGERPFAYTLMDHLQKNS
ncbi:MAG: GNAT family N-acetyltransferase [Muribaculum sp.]|nr:GNAT family N-acetyltransferase [Muribaculum sp.]